MHTLFDRLGGAPAIEAAVDAFYGRVLADPLLRPMFAQVPMDRLRAHQRRFLGFAFGGASEYAGRGLARAHAGLVAEHGLDHRHFDAVLGHLDAALCSLGVGAELVAEVRDVAESVRSAVLGP